MVGYTRDERAGEHLRNALMIAASLREHEVVPGSVMDAGLEAIERRLRAALDRIEGARVTHGGGPNGTQSQEQ